MPDQIPVSSLVTDGTTFITPLGLCFTLAMSGLLILLPRKWALIPVIVLTCYMTMGERIIIVGLDFTMLRILTLFGWARLFLRGELKPLRLNWVDKAVIWWVISSTIIYTLLWHTGGALIYRLGQAYNALGMYFLFRFLIRKVDDLTPVVKSLAVLMVPLAVAMLVEKQTGRNGFAIFGGVSEITVIREDVLRCQGPFAHPILAGTFGAITVPLFAALWVRGNKLLATIGIAAATVITITSASSGPVMTYLAGLIGFFMWGLRRHMRQIRWAILLTLIGLHMVMKAPVWFLLARVSVFSGSTGWHRAYLIDRAIANFWDWWLLGTKSTAAWGGRLFDVTNQYVSEGAGGGLITMVLFILIIVRCFSTVGTVVWKMRDYPRSTRLAVWALGAALLGHVVTFLGVTYFDQNIVMWYMLLAMIASLASLPLMQVKTEAVLMPSPEPLVMQPAALSR